MVPCSHNFKEYELLSAIKIAIDADRKAGAFILTGSCQTHDQKEIDFIIERHGKIAAIEVKFAKQVSKEDCRHILDLARSSSDFHIGIVIYMGTHVVMLAERIWAVPFGRMVQDD